MRGRSSVPHNVNLMVHKMCRTDLGLVAVSSHGLSDRAQNVEDILRFRAFVYTQLLCAGVSVDKFL